MGMPAFSGAEAIARMTGQPNRAWTAATRNRGQRRTGGAYGAGSAPLVPTPPTAPIVGEDRPGQPATPPAPGGTVGSGGGGMRYTSPGGPSVPGSSAKRRAAAGQLLLNPASLAGGL